MSETEKSEAHHEGKKSTSWSPGTTPGWRGQRRWRSLREKKGEKCEIREKHQQHMTR